MQHPGKEGKKNLYIWSRSLDLAGTIPIYVTGYQFNGTSGPGCIAYHHFGTCDFCLQKNNKLTLKTNIRKTHIT